MRDQISIIGRYRFNGIYPLGVRVIPGTAATAHLNLNSTQIKNVVPGAKARSLAAVWGLEPPRSPYAGRSK